LTAFSISFIQEYSNAVSDSDQELRILAVGESTTAQWFSEGREASWPGILQEILMKSYPKNEVRVINEGVPGIDSTAIMQRMPQLLAKYRPHIVITMIGYNDHSVAFLVPKKAWYQSLKTVKVFVWAVRRALSLYTSKVWSKTIHNRNLSFDEKTEPIFLNLKQAIASRDYAAFQRLFRQLIDKYPRESGLIDYRIGKLADGIGEQERFKPDSFSRASIELYRKALLQFPAEHDLAVFYSYTLESHGEWQLCEEFWLEKIIAGYPLSFDMRRTFLACINGVKRPALMSRLVLWVLGLSHSQQRPIEITAHNYRNIARLLAEEAIPLVAVQYANHPVNRLQDLFNKKFNEKFYSYAFYLNGPDIEAGVDVSKHQPFDWVELYLPPQERQADYVYNDLFTDRIGKKFGHTTAVGHQMIAEQVAPVIMRAIKHHRQKKPKQK
jgi:lysophospholipase L1-like esterase